MLTDAQEELTQKAREALRESPVAALRNLDVEAAAGRVIISGIVNCFYHKQLAQEVVRSVLGGIRVINAVVVQDPRRRRDDAYLADSFIG